MLPMIDFVFHKNATGAEIPNPYIVTKADEMTVQISGDASDFEVIFEAITDSEGCNGPSKEDPKGLLATWTPVAGVNMTTFEVASSTTENGIFAFSISGFRAVRARLASIGGGSANVIGKVITSTN